MHVLVGFRLSGSDGSWGSQAHPKPARALQKKSTGSPFKKMVAGRLNGWMISNVRRGLSVIALLL